MVTIIGVILIAVAVWAVIAYNGLVRLRNQVRTAWADIDVQLRRRHDLVPQLVSAVKGYAGYERSVLTTVTELRAQAMALTSPAKLGETALDLARVEHLSVASSRGRAHGLASAGAGKRSNSARKWRSTPGDFEMRTPGIDARRLQTASITSST